MNEQQQASLDPFLRQLSKRVPHSSNLLGSPSIRREPKTKLPPKLSDLEESSLTKAKETEKEQGPRREPKQSDTPIRRESPASELGESLSGEQSRETGLRSGEPPSRLPISRGQETGIAEGEAVDSPSRPSQGYDARDAETGENVSGMKQEKLRREKNSAQQGMRFAKAGAAFVGRMMGGAFGKATGGIPSEMKSALRGSVGDMFGGSGEASVSSEGNGGGPGSEDMGVKLDRIIELLSQIVQASGKSEVAGPQADGSFVQSPDLAQSVARHAAAAGAAGGSISKSNKDSSSDDMMTILLQTLIKAAIAAV